MITVGYLRQVARELIWQLVDKNKMQYDDIRYVKGNGGVFPSRFVKHINPTTGKEEVKATPYLSESDTFVLFDVEPKDNIASEPFNEGVGSMWSFNLIINVYGRDSDYIIQYISAVLHAYSVKSWLLDQNISLMQIPSKPDLLDGFENNEWWIRRKLVLEMNISQIITLDGGDDLEKVEFDVEGI